MCKKSEENFKKENFEDIAYFEPFYLKDFYTSAKKISR
jgi:tRNA threonylcarbamoyladenosine biosynthesis protein TsaB